ncbi:MAG: FKBP-type peptidyl-prolyl cis-trans isomerase [Ferrovibrio sp.]|uniref:FKBP-type peptidyl-prolyl cis-trans isomerase n=1 Tax=Ferrovibrio sp. TaxID=1917215 RepID=UPI0026128B5B|nr:FKBP-type peptidyl-prolyl cis-trans isomerase [Ferrovibrio sp.]MCW0235883.1 FKBP-type peptidyl-prolyl cis-trans isomerase [Ferrovibrio sp.]
MGVLDSLLGAIGLGGKQEAVNLRQTPSGMRVGEILAGTGTKAEPGKTVSVHYAGWIWENNKPGRMFDSSYKRGQPFEFALGQGKVIKGWDEGVAYMKVGGKRALLIPSYLAYGARGNGRIIPPNATLFFEIELVNVR